MKIFIKTFGCRTNIYDSEQIAAHLAASGAAVVEDEAQADAVIINGCTVTNGADRTTAAYIRALRRKNPRAKVVLSGCSAPALGRKWLAAGQIDGVLGASEKQRAAGLIAGILDGAAGDGGADGDAAGAGGAAGLSGRLGDLGAGGGDSAARQVAAGGLPTDGDVVNSSGRPQKTQSSGGVSGGGFYAPGSRKFVEKPTVSTFAHHTKAFVKIQEGCDFNCSYCIIPAVRGRSRSIAERDILRQCRDLIAAGHREIVLTGTNMGSYGRDIASRGGFSGSVAAVDAAGQATSLASLLQKIGALPGLVRVRLGSLESAQIDEAFLELLGESWLERHLHIALQHTHPQMLSLMRRRNTALGDLALFERLAAAGYALGSDFIVGHPGETPAIWREAMANFARYPLTHLHAFIYSKRAGTHSVALARELGEVAPAVAKERLHELTEHVAAANLAFRRARAADGTALLVQLEQCKNGFYQGYDQFYNLLKVPAGGALADGDGDDDGAGGGGGGAGGGGLSGRWRNSATRKGVSAAVGQVAAGGLPATADAQLSRGNWLNVTAFAAQKTANEAIKFSFLEGF